MKKILSLLSLSLVLVLSLSACNNDAETESSKEVTSSIESSQESEESSSESEEATSESSEEASSESESQSSEEESQASEEESPSLDIQATGEISQIEASPRILLEDKEYIMEDLTASNYKDIPGELIDEGLTGESEMEPYVGAALTVNLGEDLADGQVSLFAVNNTETTTLLKDIPIDSMIISVLGADPGQTINHVTAVQIFDGLSVGSSFDDFMNQLGQPFSYSTGDSYDTQEPLNYNFAYWELQEPGGNRYGVHASVNKDTQIVEEIILSLNPPQDVGPNYTGSPHPQIPWDEEISLTINGTDYLFNDLTTSVFTKVPGQLNPGFSNVAEVELQPYQMENIVVNIDENEENGVVVLSGMNYEDTTQSLLLVPLESISVYRPVNDDGSVEPYDGVQIIDGLYVGLTYGDFINTLGEPTTYYEGADFGDPGMNERSTASWELQTPEGDYYIVMVGFQSGGGQQVDEMSIFHNVPGYTQFDI